MWTVQDRNHFMPNISWWHSLRRFSWNSNLLDKFLWKCPAPNFIHLGWKNIETAGTIVFSVVSKAWLSLNRFSGNSRLLNNLMCGYPPYRIFPQICEKKYGKYGSFPGVRRPGRGASSEFANGLELYIRRSSMPAEACYRVTFKLYGYKFMYALKK